MKAGDFVEYRDFGRTRFGRVTEVANFAVHVQLFDGAQLIADKDALYLASLPDVWRAVEEEIAKVEAKAADRVRELRAEARNLFDRALDDRK